MLREKFTTGKFLPTVCYYLCHYLQKIDDAKFTTLSNTAGIVERHFYKENVSLPFANTQYHLRVRMHTARGDVRDEMWSAPSYLNVTTLPKRGYFIL